jgi:hypothetical protein
LTTLPSVFPTLATASRIGTENLPVRRRPTSTGSDCIGNIVAAPRAAAKRPKYDAKSIMARKERLLLTLPPWEALACAHRDVRAT